jgi:uncharacterized membrane protein YbhN (UPF0104 family)
MKILSLSIIALVSYLAACASCIWALVEFILYLVKDRPFNWWSVWTIIICGVFALVMVVIYAVVAAKENKRDLKKFQTRRKSNFEERLEKMAEERNRDKGSA